ncbi:MAG TPA: hypothetical protein VKX39_01360 [Bryobacteraceae bacterium]|jgi:hypothetical protein|nr:hypothetical protein [Bryobacteraceae bacterium]
MNAVKARAPAIFDRIYSSNNRARLERWIVAAAVVLFAAHLACIFAARHLANPPAPVSAAGKNFLSAIYTPFSVILFYEVLVLIAAIPQSATRGLETQYEIVSLIFVRGFFKDIASLDVGSIRAPLGELSPALVDAGAGLLMFLLVALFGRAAGEAPAYQASPAMERLIAWKKRIALVLTVVFLWFAAASVYQVEFEIFHPAATVGESRAGFYAEVFTAMIFTDVLILLLSLLASDRYEEVFRNAAFVIAAILIRFSLTAAHPLGAILGIAGMLFGIFTLVIYNFRRGAARE